MNNSDNFTGSLLATLYIFIAATSFYLWITEVNTISYIWRVIGFLITFIFIFLSIHTIKNIFKH